MPSSPLLVHHTTKNLKDRVTNLAATPGYCIFVDIVGSTAMKQQSMFHWIALIHNTFSNVTTFLDSFAPLKGIGDELMYYIEEADLTASGYSPMQIFDALYQIANETEQDYPKTKIVAAYCSSVFPMTFIPGARDYYGIDIDRAARLKGDMTPAVREGEVLIDEGFYNRIMPSYEATGNKPQFISIQNLQGPTERTLKGIAEPVRVYRTLPVT